MTENLYSIRIDKSGRYVRYCDDCWYEATDTELRLFTKEEAEKIAAQMRNHYVYNVTISNGKERIVIGRNSKRPVDMTPAAAAPKKCMTMRIAKMKF